MGKSKQKGKTLHNSSVSAATQNVSDLQKYGDCDTFKLICKASSAEEGWMKSTKAMEIPGVGCVVQVTTQQGKRVAEALTFVPGVRIDLIGGDKKNGRRLVQLNAPAQYGDVAEQAVLRAAVQDSLPAQGIGEIVAGINERAAKSKLTADVAGLSTLSLLVEDIKANPDKYMSPISARQRVAYHDLMRFDGSEASANAIIDWVNSASDLCSVVYDTQPVQSNSIAISWNGEHPISHINVGDFVRVCGNGAVSLLSEAQALAGYDFMTYTGEAECMDTDVRVVEQRYNAKGGEVDIHYYDGTPECAGRIVNAGLGCHLSSVCYGRDGLTVYNANQGMANFIVREGHYVVIDGDSAVSGSREWLDTAYPA